MRNVAAALIVFSMLFLVQSVFGQDAISLDNALTRALVYNREIQLSHQKVEQNRLLLPTAFNVYGPEVIFEAPNGDAMRYGVMQSFQYPGVYTAQHKVQQGRVELSESEKNIAQNNIRYRVMSAYVELQYLKEKVDLLNIQDSVYSDILFFNEVRYKVGQISNLEKINGEAQYKRIQYNLVKATSEWQNSIIQFALLLGVAGDTLFVPDLRLYKMPELDIPQSENDFTNNPLMGFHQKQERLSSNLLKVEKRRRVPGFSIGYLNQGVANESSFVNRLRGGIMLPLWYWTYSSGIKAAQVGLEIAQKQTDLTNYQLDTEFSKAQNTYRQYLENLQYFSEVGLRQIEELTKAAKESYRLGSIGYYQYLQNLELAYESKLNYFDNLKNYNQALIYIKYLKGEL